MVVAERGGYSLAALRNSRLYSRLGPCQRLYAPFKTPFAEVLERLIVPFGHHDILQTEPNPSDKPIVKNNKFRTRNVALGKFKLAVHDVADKNRMHHRVRALIHREIAKVPELAGKERQCGNAVISTGDRHEMSERSRTEIVLLGDEHRGVFIHALPYIPLKYKRVLSEIVRMKNPLHAHRHGLDLAGTPRGFTLYLLQELSNGGLLHGPVSYLIFS